jgi:hypothetical protein
MSTRLYFVCAVLFARLIDVVFCKYDSQKDDGKNIFSLDLYSAKCCAADSISLKQSVWDCLYLCLRNKLDYFFGRLRG